MSKLTGHIGVNIKEFDLLDLAPFWISRRGLEGPALYNISAWIEGGGEESGFLEVVPTKVAAIKVIKKLARHMSPFVDELVIHDNRNIKEVAYPLTKGMAKTTVINDWSEK